MMPRKAILIRTIGIVQGVGFRPFIYRIAVASNLKGYVKNRGGAEVEIYVEGRDKEIQKFIREILTNKPPSAKIEKMKIIEVEPKGYEDFVIEQSERKGVTLSMIPPDFSICNECLKEILDLRSRWYGYPFNSCAWCGPRFTIIESLPYDRERTTMRDFPLCEECLREYNDPLNIRRFHAEGISCPKCGPKVFLLDNKGKLIEDKDPIELAARLIDEGSIVAIKGIGGFHISALATDDEIILELRRRKRRPQKPFALMALNLDVAERLVIVNDFIERLLTSLERPILVLKKKEEAPVSKFVAPGLDTLGIMLPYTGLHYLLLSKTRDRFLIMTSGNPRGEPICIDNESALKKLKGIVDYFLVHNRRIVNRVDDSVIRITGDSCMFLRRSRGYAPKWIKLPFKLERPIIAFGAFLSNVAAIGIDEYAIPTQFLGDMDDWETINFAERAISFLLSAYNINPKGAIIAADMNPSYITKSLAEEWSEKYEGDLVLVQHHHAHIASVMAEKGLSIDEEVVGIGIDGAGYGVDKRIWGGEVMIANYTSFRRVGHLRYQKMPGGDLATIYPVRMLIGILSSFMDEEEIEHLLKSELKHLLKGIPYGLKELHVILTQVYKSNPPQTSSIGRFLDAVSALLGVCLKRSYEGEPAIKLEAYSSRGKIIDLQIPIVNINGKLIIDTSKFMEEIISYLDLYDTKSLAKSIQYFLGRGLGAIATKALSRKHKYVVVSGGAAVNEYILKGIKDEVGDRATLLLPKEMPPGDGGICLGQIVTAYAKMLKN